MKLRNLILAFVLLMVSATALSAQTGFRTMNANGLSDVQVRRVSPNNAYFGFKFQNQLTGTDGAFDDNFLFNANVLYNVEFDSSAWNFPIIGNLSFPITEDSFEDIEIGIFPWRVLSQSENGNVLVLHGGFSYSISPAESEELSPQELLVLLGLELSIPMGQTNLPLSVSVAPVYRSRNLDRGNTFGIDGTVIFPIAPSLAVIGQLDVPFNRDFDTAFSAGVLVNGVIGGSNF